jgi:BirA family biotin operon repressor/biotin-[acetyl-CoA-carboxylase] ligase
VPAPTPALAALLEGPSRWHTVDHRTAVGSTNDVAASALAAGSPPGLVVVADHQTAGRGRRGRRWDDRPDGATLPVSVTLPRPPVPTLVPLAAGVALVDAVRHVGVPAVLKWPNDVLVEGSDGTRKLAGILVEARDDGLVVGMGTNVDLREQPVDGATSLVEEAGGPVDRWAVLLALLRALDRWTTDLDEGREAAVLAAYRERCTTLGRGVEVALADGSGLRGRAVDVTATGALVVDVDGSGAVTVTAGDVRHVR